jgi:sugar/nucleoside kinase (ribokinase family)
MLREQFGLDAVVLTRGASGTVAVTVAGIVDGKPAHFPPSPDADSVGAGDACAAGILIGMLLGWPDERTLTLANAAGAFVAAQPGATPQLPRSILESVTQ